ncbi:unnamed protein product, partial [Ectocarpus sp. 12 AP-2014]
MMFLKGYCRRCCEHDREGSRLFFLWPMFGLSCRSVPHAPSKSMPVQPPLCGASSAVAEWSLWWCPAAGPYPGWGLRH